jgi:hypothetical protein
MCGVTHWGLLSCLHVASHMFITASFCSNNPKKIKNKIKIKTKNNDKNTNQKKKKTRTKNKKQKKTKNYDLLGLLSRSHGWDHMGGITCWGLLSHSHGVDHMLAAAVPLTWVGSYLGAAVPLDMFSQKSDIFPPFFGPDGHKL